jgi:hypothetical protein
MPAEPKSLPNLMANLVSPTAELDGGVLFKKHVIGNSKGNKSKTRQPKFLPSVL